MSDIDQSVGLALDEKPPSGKSRLKFLMIVAAAVLAVGVGGGACWYYLLGGKAHFAGADPKQAEAPLPLFLELKPFVVTIASRNGPSRFVQLGLSFQLPNSAASDLVNAVLPKVQDTLRETLLTFKSEDLQSPDGLNRVRAAMLARLNQVLVQVLGEERIRRTQGDGHSGGLIENIYFSTLVVE
jgi:flagellar FliL protein